ncbi:PREDICTED: uncharacterized protein LOC107192599 [Dufourea novaeangliae]|uniref:uncharacterized protein LOC107192599 n=1 Tax=Dufourea novaeangliae TaxID=178035 RepID=UPI0007679DC8|nr:PREDICTED: uncharacterized protein LOC107192599 [Dufourea novaeangliae]
MAFIMGSRETNGMNNEDRERFLSFKMNEDYKFKYIPESHFKHVVKSVQRQRCKEDEERIWTSFVQEQELNDLRFQGKDVHPSIESVKYLLQENIQDVDRELKRLQEDALPERNKGICNHKSNNRNGKAPNTELNSKKNNSLKETAQIKDKGIHKANPVIPMLQEDNILNYKDSEESKKVLRSRTKKSVSDPFIIQKKHYTNQLLRATNHFESDSDSESSSDRTNTVHVQADPLIIHKIFAMQKKISELLNEISFRLHRIPLPDGDNDLKRRQQQTMEFAIRFSRNYLYNLNRLVTSIQRHIGAVSSRIRLKQCHRSTSFHQDMIKQKLIAAHQLLIQALIAYCKHIPNSTPEGHPTKLQNVLQIVSTLRDICNKIAISANYYCSGDTNTLPVENDVQDNIDAILSKLKLNLDSKHQPMNHKNVESTVTLATTSLQNERRSNKKNLSSRLSMYSIDVPKTKQKKKIDLRRKSHVYQKERKCNVVDTKNIHVQHNSIPELLYPSPVTHTSSSRDTVLIESTKKVNYLKDDDVKTMMDEVPIDSENDSNLEIQTKHSNAMKVEQSKELRKKSFTEMWKSESTNDKEKDIKVQNVSNDDDLVKKVTTITKEHLSTLVPVINDLMTLVSKKQTEVEAQPISETSMETLMGFLQKYQSPKDFDTKACSTECGCNRLHFKSNSISEVQKRDKNVQLICMSSKDKTCRTRQCDASCQADETAINMSSDRRTIRLITRNKLQLTIAKETKQRILAYKNDYKRLCELRPMYSSNTQNKPWDIVAWISDKLVEELIIETTKELPVNDMIEKLYEMEFQEF